MEQPNIGWFEGREHHYPLRVFYEDTDFSGIVYYANYLRFCERARSSFFRLVGFEHAKLWDSDDPLAFAIRKIDLEYKKPARVDDHRLIHRSLSLTNSNFPNWSEPCYELKDFAANKQI